MAHLSDEAALEIVALLDEGEELTDAGDYAAAIPLYRAALALVPAPKTAHEAASAVYSALGDVHFLLGQFEECQQHLLNALRCPRAEVDPFLHLRLGQCEFELGHLDRAAEELTRAYKETGGKVFDDKGDKYFTFLKSRMS